MQKNEKKRVVIGLSGGVDSAVSAYLLKEQGYEVIGLFMRNWDSILNNDILGNEDINQEKCPQEQDYEDAKLAAEIIGIEIHRVDFVKEYWDNVFQNFIDEYSKGRTPNPDILCNKYIKFDKMLKYAFEVLKADYLATGHYAKIINGELFKGDDESKDQSYFLAQLNKEQLSKIIFPLSNIEKSKVREIAQKINLNVANKKDSTGICFIGERKFDQFLQNYIPSIPGEILDIKSKKVIGKHYGVMYYTFGQRKGLNLGGMSEPYFIAAKNIDKKQLFAAPLSLEQEYLESNSLFATDLNINTNDYEIDNLKIKLRYRQQDVEASAIFDFENKSAIVKYNGQIAVTPGQQVVFYNGQKCIGGAIIDKVYKDGKELNLLDYS